MDERTRDFQDALRGLDYPAPRSKLIAKALENNASPETIARLNQLPETADFVNADQLEDVLGVWVPGERPRSGWQ